MTGLITREIIGGSDVSSLSFSGFGRARAFHFLNFSGFGRTRLPTFRARAGFEFIKRALGGYWAFTTLKHNYFFHNLRKAKTQIYQKKAKIGLKKLHLLNKKKTWKRGREDHFTKFGLMSRVGSRGCHTWWRPKNSKLFFDTHARFLTVRLLCLIIWFLGTKSSHSKHT